MTTSTDGDSARVQRAAPESAAPVESLLADAVDQRLDPRRFRDASPAARILVTTVTVCALVLPFLLGRTSTGWLAVSPVEVVVILLAASVVNVELARWLEGRMIVEQRPHKALSLWAFAVALTVPAGWLIPVVGLTYAHTYWRGLRPAPWKWVGSAAFVILAGLAAHLVVVAGPDALNGDRSLADLVTTLTAVVVFVGVESVLFFAISRLNHPSQEEWLRATLATPSFYFTEAGVIVVGALSVMVWSKLSWLGLLLLPVFVLMQRAALFEPLRTEALNDDKTGLLRFESWRSRTVRECERLQRERRPWAVMLVDLDHFKAFNDQHGHVAGDEALVATADALRAGVRKCDLVGRFGGEEFVILLADADPEVAVTVAARMRESIATCSRRPVTASLGIATVAGDSTATELRHALLTADRALYAAKTAGRNTVIAYEVSEAGPTG